jgi:hypothetical protein
MNTDEPILTDAERLVEEVVGGVRKAILDRATRYSRAPAPTQYDVAEACRRLFIERRWPQELIDWMCE